MTDTRKHVLVVDDDYDNFLLLLDAVKEAGLDSHFYWVKDGEEMLEYLRRTNAYKDAASAPRPDLILLDLNMPRKNGHEALAEMKAEPAIADIPVVVLTVSIDEDDRNRSLALGAQSFQCKPQNFSRLVEFMRVLKKYL